MFMVNKRFIYIARYAYMLRCRALKTILSHSNYLHYSQADGGLPDPLRSLIGAAVLQAAGSPYRCRNFYCWISIGYHDMLKQENSAAARKPRHAAAILFSLKFGLGSPTGSASD